MRKIMALLVTLAMLMLSVGAAAAQSAPSQAPVDPIEGCDYYEETGHNLCGTFLAYWESNGGLPVFGYPITEEFQEENLDTGETYTVQYFERERFELHPENAGTVYEVLLGRLGNEVLLMQGRDWQTFEKSDPSEANYIDVTGFAVAPEFIDYWSSHGLDFGEEGYSFRESLALFGYPISQAEMETNANGDTVLTQWFERARFEFHPDNPEGQQVLLGLLGVEVLDADEPEPPPPAEPDFTVVADGLNSPRHISIGGDGAIYVALAGAGGDDCVVVGSDPETGEEFSLCFGNTGSILRIVDGVAEEVVTGLPSYLGGAGGEDATGVHDVVVTADGEMYAVMGLGADPAARDALGEAAEGFGHLIKIEADGSWTSVADIAAYEGTADPEPTVVDSNPYSLLIDGDNFIVVDAGGNTLLQVTPEGEISTLAVFPPRMVLAPPFVGAPEGTEIPMESVPTDVVVGPDGAYYVSELTGFPFEVDSARVWRVMPGEEPEVYAEGFTNIGAIDFDAEGNLYVLEIFANGILQANPSDPSTAASAVTQVAPDGTQTTLATEGLVFATGLAVDTDGSIYVSNFSGPGSGQIVLLDETAAPPPAPEPDYTVVAEGLNNPRHISVGGDGNLYVAEAGAGGDECVSPDPGAPEFMLCFGNTGSILQIVDGEEQVLVEGLPSYTFGGADATGVHDVAVTEDGTIYAVIGLDASVEERDMLASVVTSVDAAGSFGHLIQINLDGSWTSIADLAAYEAANNTDGFIDELFGGMPDLFSNPYSLMVVEDGWVVVDAGANALLHVDTDGSITPVAVFPPQMVAIPEDVEVPPEVPSDIEIPMQSVPTSVVMGPDGAYYVGELTGFPFIEDTARVWRVAPGEEPEVYATGFTNIGAIDFDAEGNLYVLEIVANGLRQADPANPETAVSAVIMVAQDDTQTTLDTDGLYFATGLAVGADGEIYISNIGTPPGTGELGQVVMLNAADETEETEE